jgi:hypothetical protein
MNHPRVESSADEPPDEHGLGPLEFDRGELVYYATCRCGQRFGPVPAIETLRAEFDQHLAQMAATSDRPGAAGT